MTIESGSRRSANGTCRSPEAIQVNRTWSTTRRSAGTASSDQADAADTRNDPNIAATARPPETDLDSRRPSEAFARNPRNGSSGINSSMLTTSGT